MTLEKITDYNVAAPKTQQVIDYCARYAVVPRAGDDPHLPAPWTGLSSGKVQEGMAERFGLKVAQGQPLRTWQRLGADNDLEAALSMHQQRREDLLDAGLNECASWK